MVAMAVEGEEPKCVFFGEDPPDRFSLYPIRHQDIYDFYKRQQASLWTLEEIDLGEDGRQFERDFTEQERGFLKKTLAFFSGFDHLVMQNITLNFENEVPFVEARFFYAIQNYIEGVHAETYAQLIDTLVPREEKAALFKALKLDPTIARKAEWAQHYMDQSIPLGERLVAWAVVEGVFFSGAFCTIYWLKVYKKGKMSGVTFSNELIARDEALHRDFAVLLFKKLASPPSEARVREIVTRAIEIEKEFVREALPVRIIGMNADSMCQYVEFVADHLWSSLGYEDRLYGSDNPFDWMEQISLGGKTNFFEKRVGEYQKAGVANATEHAHVFSLDEEF